MKAEQKHNDGLSGKFYFHSLYKNIGAYIRESGEVEGHPLCQIFLVYKDKYWFITDDARDDEMFGGDFEGGRLCIETDGYKNERKNEQDH